MAFAKELNKLNNNNNVISRGADRGACLDVNGDTGSGAEASAAGAPDRAPTTLPAMPPPAEDGAGASTADAPDHDMTMVTDAALTEDAAHDPSSTRHAGAADGLGGPRDRASRGYGPRDEAEIRRRRRLQNKQRLARNRR